MRGESVVFIAGCMRSGTTLVQRLLCAAKGASPIAAECQYLTALVSLHEGWSSRYDQFLKDYFPSPVAFEAFSRKPVDEFLADLGLVIRARAVGVDVAVEPVHQLRDWLRRGHAILQGLGGPLTRLQLPQTI